MDETKTSIDLEYSVTEEEHLTALLHSASQSKRIQKRMRRSKIGGPLFFIALGILLMLINKTGLGVAYCILAVCWYFIYPLYDRYRFVKHYKSFISEKKSKESYTSPAKVHINDQYIFISDTDGNEQKIMTKEIIGIDEIESLIMIKHKAAGFVMIPKSKVANLQSVTEWLRNLSAKLEVPYTLDLKWAWK